jgi:hypothetical protein
MKRTKKMDWAKHAAVLSITVLVFFTGILLGTLLNKNKIDAVQEISDELRLSTMSSEVEFAILAENPCEVHDLGFLSDDLHELSLKVEFMENQLGSRNKDVQELKSFYSIIQLRHWVLMTKIKEECNNEAVNIIYFYSNEGECRDCADQGFILSYLKRTEKVNIYSIDINTNNNAVRTLKEVYKIRSAPTLIIDKDVYEGFKTLNQLKEIMNNDDD